MKTSIYFLAVILSIAVTVRAQCSDEVFGTCQNGETCYAACDLEFDGYKSARCVGTAYEAPDLSHCVARSVSLFSYGVETLDCFVGKAIPTLSIRTDGSVQSYAVTPDLPAGITLNTENGELSGTPSAASVSTEYTITGTVGESSVTTTITIEVDILMCVAMDSFPAAADGAYASSTSACPTGYQGTAKRLCTAGHFGDIDITGCTHKAPVVTYSTNYVNVARLTAFVVTPTIQNEFTSVTASALPAGVTMTDKGTIAGVPTATGTSAVTVTVTGPGGPTTATVTITVTAAQCSGLTDSTGSSAPRDNNSMISFACEEGYQGTWTYTCLDGVYKNKNVNTCTPKSPTIMYPVTFYELTQGESINTGAPHVTNIVTVYSVEGNLPEGLTLDETTGVVSGTLNDVLEATSFKVVGKPYVGAFVSSKWEFTIIVNPPSCAATEDFNKANSGSSSTFTCPEGYEGTMKRKCVTKNGKGQWKTPETFCQKKPDFTFLIISAIILVVCIIFCIIGCVVKSSRQRTKTTKSLKPTKASSKPASKAGSKAAPKPVAAAPKKVTI